ncbi:MAG: hypothetical protein ACYSUI_21360, partial [Planctomycetota bacterium]
MNRLTLTPGPAVLVMLFASLLTAIPGAAEAPAPLENPQGLVAVAQNNSVELQWLRSGDPDGKFDHYAVYRSTAEFSSVDGMVPIFTNGIIDDYGHSDHTVVNGTSYYYAVTAVWTGGAELKDVVAAGPRTPRDESDLQVVSISRTPRYPRYWPEYTYYELTEPSGYGPYVFSAATGLGGGQTCDTPRWPEIGDPVTYLATVRNRGTNPWEDIVVGNWYVDGTHVSQQFLGLPMGTGYSRFFKYVLDWDGEHHEIRFRIEVNDARSANNALSIDTKSVPVLAFVDNSYIEDFREIDTPQFPNAVTDDIFDWLNHHIAHFNDMFEDAGSPKRLHYDVLEETSDNAPDPVVDLLPFAIFPFRFYAGQTSLRHAGYYRPDVDIDYGLLHEMGHQLGLVDIYQLDVPETSNEVSGYGYIARPGLMHGVSDFISTPSGFAMNLWLDEAHGYYGQYMYRIPSEMRLRILGYDGAPLEGATVKMYQYAERPGRGKVITDQIKSQGVTDSNGEFVLPNVPIDPGKVPPICTGDTLGDNPFGYLAVVGTNGVLHFLVEHGGTADHAWLDITEANVAYFEGRTDVAVFERQLSLGGPPQHIPPPELTELNARDWDAWGRGSGPENTYVEDDESRTVLGEASVKFVTDGAFDTYVRYPRSFTAHWDLSTYDTLTISLFAENPNYGFQLGSPWIRLKDAENNYFEYRYFDAGQPYDLLNEARGRWQSHEIPLVARSDTRYGWRRTAHGTPDLSRIQYLEIHADTWDGGFVLWLDGVGFRALSRIETLGPPGIVTAPGSGIAAAGTGLENQPGWIDVEVPSGATVTQALLYWAGATAGSAPGDDTIVVNGIEASGTLIGGPAYFYTANEGEIF